jgi:glc operon protein GlcG
MSQKLYVNTGRITLDGAKLLAGAARDEAQKRRLPGAVAVVDDGGNLVYVERWDGTMPNAPKIAIDKATTAMGFGRPTIRIEEAILKGRTPMLSLSNTVDYAPLMGGYPVEMDGIIVGAFAIAGALTGENDEMIAVEALKVLNANQKVAF